jgi:hypothetical protein
MTVLQDLQAATLEASYAPFRVIPAIELRALDIYLISQRPIVPSARRTRRNAPSPKPRALFIYAKSSW